MTHLHFRFNGEENAKRLLELGILRWERLSINWFQYRCKLKELTARHNDKLGIPIIDADRAMSMAGRRDVVLLPIDDDDVLDPKVIRLIGQAFQDSSVEAFEWKTWCYSLLHGEERYYVEPDPTPSNCYAVRGDVLNLSMLVAHLSYASDENIQKKKTEEILGMRFLHPASMYRMQLGNTLVNLGSLRRNAAPKGLEWAFEIIDDFYELTDSLKPVVKML